MSVLKSVFMLILHVRRLQVNKKQICSILTQVYLKWNYFNCTDSQQLHNFKIKFGIASHVEVSQISITVFKLSSTMEDKQSDFGTNNSSSVPYPSKNLEFPYHPFNYFSLSEMLLSLCWLYGTKYSRMDQCEKLVEQPLKNLKGCGLFKAYSFKFLKVIFHKF